MRRYYAVFFLALGLSSLALAPSSCRTDIDLKALAGGFYCRGDVNESDAGPR
jgi:hypothetical protein